MIHLSLSICYVLEAFKVTVIKPLLEKQSWEFLVKIPISNLLFISRVLENSYKSTTWLFAHKFVSIFVRLYVSAGSITALRLEHYIGIKGDMLAGFKSYLCDIFNNKITRNLPHKRSTRLCAWVFLIRLLFGSLAKPFIAMQMIVSYISYPSS